MTSADKFIDGLRVNYWSRTPYAEGTNRDVVMTGNCNCSRTARRVQNAVIFVLTLCYNEARTGKKIIDFEVHCF